MSNVEHFAAQAAQLPLASFREKLGALGVLVRLDERGGDDEPAPWAFHHASHIPQTAPRDDENVDAEALRAALPNEGPDPNLFADDDDDPAADAETVTRTFAGSPRLPIPPARGAATVYVVGTGAKKSVGRQDGVDVVIAERSVSKEHGSIETDEDGTFSVVDNGSRNGTKVNNRRIKSGKNVPLRPGDIVLFGDVMCLFLTPELLFKHVASFMD